jgi:hypothetical protein
MDSSYNMPIQQRVGMGYDKVSIMIYPSWAWSGVNGGVEDVPLEYWKNGGKNGRPPQGTKPNKDNSDLVYEVYALLDGDKEFVKTIHPWNPSRVKRHAS